MRIMGVDYGDARTGIAVSDLLCSIVGSTEVIHSRNFDKTLEQVTRLAKELGVTEISYEGTTFSEVSYGDPIALEIKGKLKGEYGFVEKRVSTAKN